MIELFLDVPVSALEGLAVQGGDVVEPLVPHEVTDLSVVLEGAPFPPVVHLAEELQLSALLDGHLLGLHLQEVESGDRGDQGRDQAHKQFR